MTKKSTKAGQGVEPKGKRTRLSPEVRRKQILDAALIEFSALGFTATSISKIAERVGISKANVYAHFSSKDEIFETLLQSLSSVGRSQGNWSKIKEARSLAEFVDNLIDVTYGALTPEALAIIRLLIAEGHRIPDVMAKWHETNLQRRAERQAVIDELVSAGHLKASPLTENFEFAMTPVVYAAVAKLAFGAPAADEVERIKDTHRKVLHLLLEP